MALDFIESVSLAYDGVAYFILLRFVIQGLAACHFRRLSLRAVGEVRYHFTEGHYIK